MLKEQRGPDGSAPDPADALDPWGVNQQLRRIAKRAGIERAVNPHRFRHTAITRMVYEGVREQDIKWIVGWAPDSAQFERYTHLTDDDRLRSLAAHYDIEWDDDTDSFGKPTLDTCVQCGTILSGWLNPVSCPGCGLAFDERAISDSSPAEHVMSLGPTGIGKTRLFVETASFLSSFDEETRERILRAIQDMPADPTTPTE